MDAATATLIAGGLGIAGALLGVVVGLFGERLVRTWGDVRCEIDGWGPISTTVRAGGGHTVRKRHLQVTFRNQKDIPVTVWDLRVGFYKGDLSLEAWAQPSMAFVDDHGRDRPLSRVDLPPHLSVPLTISLVPDREDKLEELEGVTRAEFRAEFVATLVGAKDIRRPLPGPWHVPPKEESG